MPKATKKDFRTTRDQSASITLKKRSQADIVAWEITRKYEDSLEAAAKKCLESLRHLESVAFGYPEIPEILSEARRSLMISLQLIVRSGITDQRKKSYVKQKDVAINKKLISQRKKLEDDHFLGNICAGDDFDIGCQSATG